MSGAGGRGGVKRQLTQEMILDPLKRVRELSEIGSSVTVDKSVPVKRYFRSGSEMERQVRKGAQLLLWSCRSLLYYETE